MTDSDHIQLLVLLRHMREDVERYRRFAECLELSAASRSRFLGMALAIERYADRLASIIAT